MHRLNVSKTTIVLTICVVTGTVFTGSGCRNSFPENQVRLQSKPSGTTEGIEEPPSRLHGAFGFGRGKKADRGGDATQESVEAKFAAQTSKVRQASAESSGASFNLSDTAPTHQAQAPLTREEQEMLIEAFEEASPEIRRLAERRMSSLKAQAAKSAANHEQTEQQERLPTLDRDASASGGLGAATAENRAALPGDDSRENLKNAVASNPADSNNRSTASTSANRKKANPEEFEMPDLSSSTSEGGERPEEMSAEKIANAEKTKNEPRQVERAIDESPGSGAEAVQNASHLTADEDQTAGTNSEKSAVVHAGKSEPTSASSADEVIASVSEKVLLEELIRREKQRFAEATETGESALGEIVRLRMYQLFAGELEEATQPVEGWAMAEQEFLNHQTMALWHMIDPASHPVRDRRWATALPEFRQAAKYLGDATGTLHVHNLAFCTAVDGYGQLTAFANDRFTAGQQVILYSEVENFGAERLSDGYETHLRGTYRILDATGRRVAEQVLAEDQQTSKNYRRDYFLPYILHLPDRLTPGNYRFELWLEDVKGKKFGTASIPFEIVTSN